MPGRVFFYTRSTIGSPGSGAEAGRLKALFESDFAHRGFQWGGIFDDSPNSSSLPFASRPSGRLLLLAMESGDAVVFEHSFHAFNGPLDLANFLFAWHTHRVEIHLLDIGLDSRSAVWQEVIDRLPTIAHFIGSTRSRLRRDAVAHARQRGKLVARPPYGFRCVGSQGDRRLVPDRRQREIGRQIVALKQEGRTWEAIYWHLRRQKVRTRRGKQLGIGAIRRWFEAECRLLEQEDQETTCPERLFTRHSSGTPPVC
jgi:hypothetical protein